MAANDIAPSILVVFGATGDLMVRKIVPALFYLFGKGRLPERLSVLGFSRREWADEHFQAHVRAILAERAPHALPHDVDLFVEHFRFQRGTFEEDAAYDALRDRMASIEHEWGVCANKLFYLAVPPENYETIFRKLAASGLTAACSDLEGWTRVLVEKPFGDDERTARELDTLLGTLFREEQIYRIDHYLAKEMLQGIMNFRFTNNLFETEWNREAIERIDITLREQIGVERRGAFYDRVGALRDVGQNHLLQMLALVTMEQPASSSPHDIREARADLIESLPHLTPGEVARDTFRAQYRGYREISGVAPDSTTETYFKIRFRMAGPRWAGVPVTLESGKRLGPACKRIVVTFRHPHPCLCDKQLHVTNKVVFTLEPDDRIEIVFWAKRPGFDNEVEERRFSFFLYEKTEKAQYVEEYGRLLYDAFRGDQTLFVSTREVDAGWRFIDPIIRAWEEGAVPLETYEPDSTMIAALADEALASPRSRGAVGVVGLGKMGAGIARNLMDDGWRVVGYNRSVARARELEPEGLVVAGTLEDLVASLAPPRVVWVMVPAGPPVEEVLFGGAAAGGRDATGRPGLADLLSPGDVIIDGGNSHWRDAARRAERLAERGVRFLDCGVSGGPHGARTGATLMVGGDREVFDALEPLFADAAAPGGYRYVGGHGAGHFVKMVHNGIEYGMMQAIAEGFTVLRSAPFRFDLEEIADLYQHRSVIESRLVGWLVDAFREHGDDLEGVSGVVGHTGEAAWTIETARELGVKVAVIEESLRFRERSADSPSYTGRILTALRDAFGGHGVGTPG